MGSVARVVSAYVTRRVAERPSNLLFFLPAVVGAEFVP
jgi:hypothetical protein